MKVLKIDINVSENGVFIPTSSAVKKAANTASTAHSRIHTDVYKQNVFDRLNKINNKADFER